MRSQKRSLLLLLGLLLLLFVGAFGAKKVGSYAERLSAWSLNWIYDSPLKEEDLEKERLQAELQAVKLRNHRLEEFIKEEISYLSQLRKSKEETLHQQQLKRLLEAKEQGVVALINWRSPIAWNSSLWVDKGEKEGVGVGAIALSENALLGIVDAVEDHRAHILLITDPEIKVAVRALRKSDDKERFLAKGELRGSRSPQFRRFATMLKGEGFNYQFSDSLGEPLDLRGKEHIIDIGDTLITSKII